MKPARLIISALILLMPMACVALRAKPRPAASVEQEIKDVEQRANAAYEANDLAKYFSFYASDFSQFLPEGRTDLAGCIHRRREPRSKGRDFRHAHSGRSEQRYSSGELPLACTHKAEGWKSHRREQPGI